MKKIDVSLTSSKVRDYPEWANQPRYKYIAKHLHTSAELQYFYNVPNICGPGNYANLGVFRGASVAYMARGIQDFNVKGRIYGVDCWESELDYRSPDEGQKRACDRLEEYGVMDYVEICRGYTKDWAEKLRNKTFRFVLIDADHKYEGCKEDFELWSPLVEKGGYVAFHDVDLDSVGRVIDEIDKSRWQESKQVYRLRTFRKV